MRASGTLLSLLGVTLVALLVSGCTAEGQKQNVSKVRVFNALFDSPGVKVSVPEKDLANGLAYQARTGYVDVTSGTLPFIITSASGEKLAESSFVLANERSATFVITGIGTTYGGLLFDDQVSQPSDGRVRARFIHAASGVGALDAYLTKPGESIANLFPTYAASLGLFTNFSEFSADTYILRLTVSGTKDVVYESDPIIMANRDTLSLVAYSSGSQRMTAAARLAHDAAGAITLLPSKVTRIRVANAVANTPIDVLVDGTSQATNVAAAALSPGINVTPGSRAIRVDATATPGTALVTSPLNFVPGRDYTVLAMGSGTSATLTQFLDTTLSVTATTRVRVRVINGIVGGETAVLKLGTTELSRAAPGAVGVYGDTDVGTFDVTVTGLATNAAYFTATARQFTALDYNLRYAVLLTGTPASVKAELVAE